MTELRRISTVFIGLIFSLHGYAQEEVSADDLEKAVNCFAAGDYDCAFRIYKALKDADLDQVQFDFIRKLPEIEVIEQTINIRSHPRAESDIQGIATKGTVFKILSKKDNWCRVYDDRGSDWRTGYVLCSQVQEIDASGAMPGVTAEAVVTENTEIFPARPEPKPGYVTCNTRCVNSACFRTYSDGRQIEFTAKQKRNRFTKKLEWDSGSC